MDPDFNSATRLMMIAPHPDDESLAAGVLLQRAVAARAAVRIVYATDGENNPWPQRLLEKRWRLTDSDRARWGKLRRKEAIAALSMLGLSGAHARFLGLPDQGITRLLLHDPGKTSSRIKQMISDWSPTHLLVPSTLDAHPDHSALAVLIQFAVGDVATKPGHYVVLCYMVHGDHERFPSHLVMSPWSDHEAMIKRQAIAEHRTQIRLSRRRFMAYTQRAERFLFPNRVSAVETNSVVSTSRTAAELQLRFRFRLQPFAERKSVYLAGYGVSGRSISISLQLPRRDALIQLSDHAESYRIGIARYTGSPLAGELSLSVEAFDTNRPIFVKISQGRWFFDDGWIEIPSLSRTREPDPARAAASV